MSRRNIKSIVVLWFMAFVVCLTMSFGQSDAFAAPKKKPKTSNAKQTITYVVAKGDSVDKIARKYEVRTDDIARWNNLADV